jgi:urease accessory protein
MRRMFDADSPYDVGLLQRAEGRLHVSFRMRSGMTVLDTLHQAGCLKARFPRRTAPEWAEAVTVNTSGGIAAGDRLRGLFSIACGARATISAQAAERVYRARPSDGPAEIENRIEIAPAAAAEWLPQQAILFDGAAVSRRIEVDLAANSQFLAVEMLVFGRALMGETVQRLRLRDRLRINRDGRALLHDAIRIEGDASALLCRRSVLGDMRGVATLVYVAPDADTRLPALRDALQDTEAGASSEDGLLVARVVAPTGAALRQVIERALLSLRGRPLPRVWLC